jgi:uncharacterized protein YaiI (UPF0178 family)
MSTPLRLLVDASQCSVKPEIYRLAARHGVRVLLVSDKEIGTPFEPWLTKVVVPDNDVSQTIADEATQDDVVITDNETLAQTIIGPKGCFALTTKGQRWTPEGPHPRLLASVRNNTRSRFLAVLDEELKTRLSAIT